MRRVKEGHPKLQEHKSWLLLFNCQAQGFANCLTLLCPEIQVEYYDPPSYRRNAEAIMSRLDSYDRILVAPRVERSQNIELTGRANVWRVPSLFFQAYHPDLCYLSTTGLLSKGPLGPHYHSAIAFSAFCRGLNEQETAGLYREDVYEALGYFNYWDRAVTELVEEFASHGIDIRESLVNWSRGGPFMHTINHPRIHCLRDVAKAVIRRAGLAVNDTDVLPHDNLAVAPVYPVFPEVGSRLGVRGSYLFKGAGSYRLMGLQEFISASFEIYRKADDLTPSVPGFFPMLEKTKAIIEVIK